MTTKKVIIYTADWCTPCKELKSLIDYANQDKTVEVIEVDIDKCPELGLATVPKVCLIDDDNKVIKCVDGNSSANAKIIADFIRGN